METKVMCGDAAVKLGAELIKRGDIVAFPTETVYGLGADALNARAVEKIFAAKNRPMDNPLIVHVACKEDIAPLVREYTSVHEKLLSSFSGALTLVFKASDIVPRGVTAGLGTVGIRIPENKTARDFIKACGTPIAAPSANLSSRVSPTSASHVYEDMKGRIPLIIDGGDCTVGIESTVLDTTDVAPVILRPGAVTAAMISAAIGDTRSAAHHGDIKVAKAPGLKYKHYAPLCEMYIGRDNTVIKDKYDKLASEGKSAVILCLNKDADVFYPRKTYPLGADIRQACAAVYGAMRAVEKNCDCILCKAFEGSGLAESVMNRLVKAAGGKTL